MFITLDQIKASVSRLSALNPFFGIAFPALKRSNLPVGSTKHVVMTKVVQEILLDHYRVADSYEGFYSPFLTSDSSNRWLKPRYGSTSLQRIMADTFADAFIHEKGTSEWGWRRDYIVSLSKHLSGSKVPAFDVAVWLYRDRKWPKAASRTDVAQAFLTEFQITKEEQDILFDTSTTSDPGAWKSELPVQVSDLLDVLGQPPGAKPAVTIHTPTV